MKTNQLPSDDIYSILTDLMFPDDVGAKTYAELKTQLRSYYGITVSVFREKKNFYKLQQNTVTR